MENKQDDDKVIKASLTVKKEEEVNDDLKCRQLRG